ncbi:MAG: hypothetical protein V3T31_00910 [candidate division Zixibacteria bacterium]
MATEFNFTKTPVNVAVLRQEIIDDVTITTSQAYILHDDPDLKIVFTTDLSGAEVTALNSVVSAHSGSPSVEAGPDEPGPPGQDQNAQTAAIHDRQSALATSLAQTTSVVFVDLPGETLTTFDMQEAGSYLITFTAQVSHEKQKGQIFFRVLVDGVEVSAPVVTSNYSDLSAATSFAIVIQVSPIAAGKVVKMQWHSDDGSTVAVARRELVINGVPVSSVLTV